MSEGVRKDWCYCRFTALILLISLLLYCRYCFCYCYCSYSIVVTSVNATASTLTIYITPVAILTTVTTYASVYITLVGILIPGPNCQGSNSGSSYDAVINVYGVFGWVVVVVKVAKRRGVRVDDSGSIVVANVYDVVTGAGDGGESGSNEECSWRGDDCGFVIKTKKQGQCVTYTE